MHILHVIGARPNFIKVAPTMLALAIYNGVRQTLVHTGQHYDANMSDVFFRQLNLPQADVNLEVGSATHALQTAEIMMRFEPVVQERKPDLMLTYGDVNSTIAAALVCAKLLIPVGHVEAGLRSFDRTMPEEVNRVITDQLANLLFTPSIDANENLLREGVAPDKIHLVGNVMIDTLVRLLPKVSERWPVQCLRAIPSLSIAAEEWNTKGFWLRRYGIVTLHRPSNVDNVVTLTRIIATLKELSKDLPLVFPMHPRVRRQLDCLRSSIGDSRLYFVDALGYLDFLALQQHAILVITDSGGIQEETTYLGIPCLTLRGSTERPITTTLGTNIIVGHDMDRLLVEVRDILAGNGKQGQVPPLWDGHAAKRIARVIMN